jgi:pyridoxal phosphate enzyme (YggS family)
MNSLESRYQALLNRIRNAERVAGRSPESVRLLAVSKRHPAELIREAHALGQRRFGENYVAEALEKMDRLGDLDLEWHYIGPIQSNKTRDIAEHFDWVHSIDRAKLVRRLSDQRGDQQPALNCLIQVHLGDEESKSGCQPGVAEELARLIVGAPRLRLRGLMAIPPPEDEPDRQRHWFAQLRQLADRLIDCGLPADHLSMGMSNDLEAAIAEQATIVRVGTDLFGPRPN